ncbi:MAG TPA: indole-3-glycerol phosphate synthase TrpC, partial [Ilumatobacteraceae bacterium]
MTTYLDAILDHHRSVAASDRRSIDSLMSEAASVPPARPFAAALRAEPGLAVIAEIKRRSPSKGDLFVGLDPGLVAKAYEQGGASCLSVLTDEPHFGGSVADLQAARAACSLPVLRKDFTVSERDVLDARIMGADCVLLIAAALDKHELRSFHELANGVGLDVLVEIHDEAELAVALQIGATIVGV